MSDASEDYGSLFDGMSLPDEDGVLFRPAFIIHSVEELSEDFENIDIFNSVIKNDFYTVKYLLDSNSKLANQTNKHGFTPLMYAANRNFFAMAQCLINKGAQVDAQNDGWTALMFAAAEGHTQMVALLVEKGANVLLAGNIRKATALIVAVSNGFGEVVDILVKANASEKHIAHADNKGRTAIVHALKRNNVNTAVKLLEIAASPKLNMDGNSDQKTNSEILREHKDGVLFALNAIRRNAEKVSPPIKPFYTNEEWRKHEKAQYLKVLLARAK